MAKPKLGQSLGGGWLLAHIDEGRTDDLGNGITREHPAEYRAERYDDQTRLTASAESLAALKDKIKARDAYLARRKKDSPLAEEGSSTGPGAIAVSRVVVPANDDKGADASEEAK